MSRYFDASPLGRESSKKIRAIAMMPSTTVAILLAALLMLPISAPLPVHDHSGDYDHIHYDSENNGNEEESSGDTITSCIEFCKIYLEVSIIA